LLLLALVSACTPVVREEQPAAEAKPATLGALPATYVNTPGCEGCLALTLTLRPDGTFLARARVGSSEFYDFGTWRLDAGALELVGGRDTRKLALRTLRRMDQVEALRGPFRLVGLFDGVSFKDCQTGLAWPLAASRSADSLKEEVRKQAPEPALVAIDARFEGTPEALVVQRPATLLNERGCP
jgi:hypothetical protein